MAVSLVRGTPGENRGPAARNLDCLVADAQEPQDTAGCIADARGQIEELLACVQRLFRLPALAGLQPGHAAPYSF